MRTIQIFGREEACAERFGERNRHYRNASFRAMYAYSLFYPAVELGSASAVALHPALLTKFSFALVSLACPSLLLRASGWRLLAAFALSSSLSRND